MQPADRAAEEFEAGCNCAQAVLLAFGPERGLDRGACLRLAAPFGGGIARTGSICGAVTGALMADGLLRAPAEATPEAKAAVYAAARRLMERFAEENGSIICRDLLGCDLNTTEGQAEARERNLHRTLCAGLVRSAAAMVADTGLPEAK